VLPGIYYVSSAGGKFLAVGLLALFSASAAVANAAALKGLDTDNDGTLNPDSSTLGDSIDAAEAHPLTVLRAVNSGRELRSGGRPFFIYDHLHALAC
jgi:hypothetical protein